MSLILCKSLVLFNLFASLLSAVHTDPTLMVPAYIVRKPGDETKRDTSGRDTGVVPFSVDSTRRWLTVLTDFAPLRPLMRPYRVVYTDALSVDREETVKVRVQGILADHRLNSTRTVSEYVVYPFSRSASDNILFIHCVDALWRFPSKILIG